MSFSIRPIRPEDMETARWVIGTVSNEFCPTEEPLSPRQKTRPNLYLTDLQEVDKRYFDRGGVFNVMTDRERVVGTGAIWRASETVCEIKQLWLLPAYRGRGLGYEMTLQLIEWAKDNHFEKMKLDVLRNQDDAVRLFRKMGFRPSEAGPYGAEPLAMELALVKSYALKS